MASKTVLSEMIEKSQRRTEILKELGAAGQRREDARREAAKALGRIRRLAQDGIGAGMTITEIAEASGVSRVTLYKLLDTKPTVRVKRRAKLKAASNT